MIKPPTSPIRWAAAIFITVIAAGASAHAGDILRGGAAIAPRNRPPTQTSGAGSEAAARAKSNAQDRLSRTTQALQAARKLQESARAAAVNSSMRSNFLSRDRQGRTAILGNVPNGLRPGGLELIGDPIGTGPVREGRSGQKVNVTITQKEQQALLDWKTFNVGKRTTLTFDQSAGGSDSGKWIAFNRVTDPSGRPSQILGSIKATGQVYVINQNGIIFGGSSQINVNTLVASTLPINENFIQRGLLNQAASGAEFLLTAKAQGSFVPPQIFAPSGLVGDVVVQRGAILKTPVSAEGTGGRVILAGANVLNQGTISTSSGQTILAAGLQVGFDAHSASDPSLRGLDVYIGDVGNYGGTVINEGIIDIPTGNLTMAGKLVEQRGVVDSTTTVALNGRIDLNASYDAVPNKEYNPSSADPPPAFLHRETGTVVLGDGSVVRILPDFATDATAVGDKLPIRSKVNIEGFSVYASKDSIIQAPNADVSILAGQWSPVTTSITDGVLLGERSDPHFVFTTGQVYLDSGAIIDVSGTTDVLVPLEQNILEVQLRGSELAPAPLQRDGEIRGATLTIDTRRTGTYQGRQWIGTPLGDASGFVNIIEHNAGYLTAKAGTVTIQAGQNFVAQRGSIIDVSGGYFRHEGGRVQTTRLRYGSRVIDIAEATPDRIYDGIYEPTSVEVSEKWGISRRFSHPLAPLGGSDQAEYLAGADGGTVSITSPGMALDGEMLGHTVIGPRQLRKGLSTSELPGASTLNLAFKHQDAGPFENNLFFPERSPTPPTVIFGSDLDFQAVTNPRLIPNFRPSHKTRRALTERPKFGPYDLDRLPGERLKNVVFPADFFEKSGFGHLAIDNPDGDFRFPPGSHVELPPEGSLTVTGKNVNIGGTIRAPGGRLSFTAYNLSPLEANILLKSNDDAEMPVIKPNNGTVQLHPKAVLDVSGLVIDDRYSNPTGQGAPIITEGGEIELVGYNVELPTGSRLDASGGVAANLEGDIAYGDGGSITIEAGQDPNLSSILGGKLMLQAELRGYSGATGGTLSIKAPLIQVGGDPVHPDTLHLRPDFFNRGGFTRFNLTGIGAIPDFLTKRRPGEKEPPVRDIDPNVPDIFHPAVYIAPGTVIEPRVTSLVYIPEEASGRRGRLVERVLPLGQRPPVSLGFYAGRVDRDFVDLETGAKRDQLLIRGDVVLSHTASIRTDPGATVVLDGQTVGVFGSIWAPGGRIEITGANSFPLRPELGAATFARPTVHIGSASTLSTAGTAVLLPDPFGRRTGIVYNGGTISVSGNILAEAGAMLDVSGASATLDVHPSWLGIGQEGGVPVTAGLNSQPYAIRTVPVQVDSSGGTLELHGSELLVSDATLRGYAGGPAAVGGTLSVSSGRFYGVGETRLGSDINLTVSQSNRSISRVKERSIGLGRPVFTDEETILTGGGFFAVDQFTGGGFDSLDLGYFDGSTMARRGGNIEFVGPVNIHARGFLRLASGGVIKSESPVVLEAPYVAIGQEFQPPVHPDDPPFIPFIRQEPSSTGPESVLPEFGKGSLRVSAQVIDIGTLVLKQIGNASFSAPNGDIRGNGTLSIAGNLTLTAAQVYPTTLSEFNIYAYDYTVPDPEGGADLARQGRVTINRAGISPAPLSAGGSLNIYASLIRQSGVLMAPFGSITLGWDGADLDPSTPEIDRPENSVVGSGLTPPVANRVVLGPRSVTSVAGIDPNTGDELLIPFGVSPDDLSIVDPRGVDVTASGLPRKQISLAGDRVVTRQGSRIDIRGGGDLFAYRWVPGNGGPVDILGTASQEWSPDDDYSAGELVTYNGRTWSARVAIDPGEVSSGEDITPSVSRYWSLVPESYAIVPGYSSPIVPYAPYNTGEASGSLGGDPGLVGTNLKVGDQIRLDGGSGLPAGTHTLLPSRYALLPGAYLVTPQTGADPLAPNTLPYTLPEGATIVTGIRTNGLNRPQSITQLRAQFEIAPSEVVAGRAEYELYSFNSYIPEAAERLELATVQPLPIDSGYLGFHGNADLALSGSVFARPPQGGRGALIDISSFNDITIIGRGRKAPGGSVILSASALSSFGAESLLIGGVRRFTAAGTIVDARTPNLLLNNGGAALTGPEITLVASETLTFAPGARLRASGAMTRPAELLQLYGSGVLVRASTDPGAAILRSDITDSTVPLLTIGSGARISGGSVILDSTYGFDLAPNARIIALALSLGAGQISILLNEDAELTGQLVSPHLVLAGSILEDIQRVDSLTLLAYQDSIDIYGAGNFGTARLSNLSLLTGEIRGFLSEGGTASFKAGAINLSNARRIEATGTILPPSGTLTFNAGTITIGGGDLNVSQFEDVILNARGGILFDGTGGLFAQENLAARTPLIVGSQGAQQNFVAGGSLLINKSSSKARVRGGLGSGLTLRGDSVTILSDILLPSGLLEVRATKGDVIIGGMLDVRGVGRRFYDVLRFTDAGEIRMISEQGNVSLLETSDVSVAAAVRGGNAGKIVIGAENGEFLALGKFSGQGGGTTGRGGSFELDTRELVSFDLLTSLLDAGGFTESRDFRVRTGDVTLSGMTKVRNFTLSVDGGSIFVDGTVDASGVTGGRIELIARDNVTLAPGSLLTVAAQQFSNAGKGGEVRLEAGAAVNGVANLDALLDLQAGSTIDLSVAEYVEGDYTEPGSSAFFGAFQGTLHLRAPRTATNDDLRISSLDSAIIGASAILAEGYEIIDLTGTNGLITGWRSSQTALPAVGTIQRQVYDSAQAFLSAANHDAMMTRLLGSANSALADNLVIAPGFEIINRDGDLQLGLSNEQINAAVGNSAVNVSGLGSAQVNSADWDLSAFRFGPKNAPGVLTLRASGNLVFNNSLSDGFSPILASTTNGNSPLWLGQLRDIDPLRPLNTQSWSYRLTAGSDLGAASHAQVLSPANLGASSGSVLVGEFYDLIPNTSTSGATAAVGTAGVTANSLRINRNIGGVVRERGTRYEVIRTGTGSIAINAARDVQLRNQFATIYTAGVRIPIAQVQNIYSANDFSLPRFFFQASQVPPSSDGIGVSQQFYGPNIPGLTPSRRTGQWALAGGNVAIHAAANIGHYSGLDEFGRLVIDTSRQVPNDWLYRRGAVDPNTGLFGSISAFDGAIFDPSASTTWWVDYSSFFQGVGALGGGDVFLSAGNDVINVDAVAPTNARMPGLDSAGNPIAPDSSLLLELGGGDVTVRAGRNIDGGIYYVERGTGTLSAQGSIKTNSTRAPSLAPLTGSGELPDERTWLPTTLFLGKGQFNVTARQDVLLGPVLNTFLMPQGRNNQTWYNTYFSTYAPDSAVNVASFGGSVTHRLAVTLPGESSTRPTFLAWLQQQNRFDETARAPESSAYYQPWLRLSLRDLNPFATVATIAPPILRSVAFGGDMSIVGSLNLAPSSAGTLELATSGAFIGLQPTGIGRNGAGQTGTAWVNARINVSDAPPASINGISDPSGRNIGFEFLREVFAESGSYAGAFSVSSFKETLHADPLLHVENSQPIRIYVTGGDIEGLTLFTPKQSRIFAQRDITNIAFYLQNATEDSISIVSAGRDIKPSNPASPTRVIATNSDLGNFIIDQADTTVLVQGSTAVTTTALSGDIQISGPGVLEVLAGRDIDLGIGPNLTDGRGVGITSIGRFRNPFLPFTGADLVVLAGVGGPNGGPAFGLSKSVLDLDSLIDKNPDPEISAEHLAIDALDRLFSILRDSGDEGRESGDYSLGYDTLDEVFGDASKRGDIFTRARDIRTTSGGAITIAAPAGGLTMASDIFGNPLTPPGIVTEYGGPVSILVNNKVDIGEARIFTLRGGDLTIWSSTGDINAGKAAKTIVTAPPTRVVIDRNSAEVVTDLGGLATGGGIGVLASVRGVPEGDVNLIAPRGTVDAGDAGIRATGAVSIAATEVLNADNISAPRTQGVPTTPVVAAPNIAGLTAASNTAGAANAAATDVAQQATSRAETQEEAPSLITVEVLGYGGGEE